VPNLHHDNGAPRSGIPQRRCIRMHKSEKRQPVDACQDDSFLCDDMHRYNDNGMAALPQVAGVHLEKDSPLAVSPPMIVATRPLS